LRIDSHYGGLRVRLDSPIEIIEEIQALAGVEGPGALNDFNGLAEVSQREKPNDFNGRRLRIDSPFQSQ
jgi:hypothetical protein